MVSLIVSVIIFGIIIYLVNKTICYKEEIDRLDKFFAKFIDTKFDDKLEIPKQIYYGECTKLIFDDGNEKFEIDANVTVFNNTRITLSNFKMDDRLNIGRKFNSIDLKLNKDVFGCTMKLYNCFVNSVKFGSEITIVGDYYTMLYTMLV